MTSKEELLRALIEEPARYTIDVQDNSMLPDNLKEKKTLDFVIKPPTLETLAKAAIPLQEIPEDLQKGSVTLQKALLYIDQVVRIICILAHGKSSPHPQWYEPFFLKNTTPKEIFQLFQEVTLKMKTDFFLTSFQIANLSNPMMMTRKNASILTI